MGMSASQARYLELTARRNNNEYQAQQIAQQKLMLANQTDAVANAFSNKMSNQQLLFVKVDANNNSNASTRLTYDIITSTDPINGLSMRLVDQNGNIVIPQKYADTSENVQNATDKYNKAINNKCFTGFTYTEGKGFSNTIYTGQNFMSTYMSGLNNDYMSNPILDKNGAIVDPDEFQKNIEEMDAPSFYDYWTKNEYSFQNTNVLNNEELYINDDASASDAYKFTMETIRNNQGEKYIIDDKCTDNDYLEKKIRSGEWTLEKVDADSDTGFSSVTWQGLESVSDSLYTADDAAAEAEYEEKAGVLARQDKMFDMRLKQLETEHTALQTEMDSVKKVIEKNVESSFKTFG
ncbi:MAG: hypothetical protein PHV37_08270 [Candidatus Gastranaerophilales bacterium]|nr:hypothetical protein [Candidatus Gastranaerophilales bacterium]